MFDKSVTLTVDAAQIKSFILPLTFAILFNIYTKFHEDLTNRQFLIKFEDG